MDGKKMFTEDLPFDRDKWQWQMNYLRTTHLFKKKPADRPKKKEEPQKPNAVLLASHSVEGCFGK